MTFVSQCKKSVNGNVFIDKNSLVPQDYELCTSFNQNSNFNENTKVIIVGTLTPKKGRDNGYFYSSPSNRMLEILDAYFLSKNRPSNLLSIKNELIKNPKDTAIIEELKSELSKNNIALLDVIKTAIASTITASDEEIIEFDLDFETFDKLKNQNVVYICNSRNAEYALNKIAKNNNQDMKIDYAPQIWRRKKEIIQNRWNEVLNKYFQD